MAVGELSLSLSPLLAISHSRKHLGDVNAPHDTTSFLGGAVNRPPRQKMQETTLLGLLKVSHGGVPLGYVRMARQESGHKNVR